MTWVWKPVSSNVNRFTDQHGTGTCQVPPGQTTRNKSDDKFLQIHTRSTANRGVWKVCHVIEDTRHPYRPTGQTVLWAHTSQ